MSTDPFQMRKATVGLIAVALVVLGVASYLAFRGGTDDVIETGNGAQGQERYDGAPPIGDMTAGGAEEGDGQGSEAGGAGIDSGREDISKAGPDAEDGKDEGAGLPGEPGGRATETGGRSPPVRIVTAESASVAGTVTDASGAPVAGARVEVDKECAFSPSAETDPSGCFLVTDLDPGSHTVAVTGPKHLFQSRAFEIKEGERALVDFVLLEGRSFTGRVKDTGGTPIAGAKVWASPPETRESREAVTDRTGTFRIEGLPARGWYWFVAVKEGYCRSDTIPIDLEKSCEIVLFKGAVVEGVVTDACTGRSLHCKEFQCHLEAPLARFHRDNETQDEVCGLFRIGPLPPGRYRIVARIVGYLPRETTEVVLKEGERKTGVQMRLARGVPMRGVVLDADGLVPVEGAHVWREAVESAVTDATGAFSLGCFPEGADQKTNVDAIHREYVHLETKVRWTVGGEPVRLLLHRGARLRGEVRRKDGTAVKGHVVVLSPEYDFGNTMYGKTAEIARDGRYEIAGLSKGLHRVGVFLESMSIINDMPVCEKEVDIESGRWNQICHFEIEAEKK